MTLSLIKPDQSSIAMTWTDRLGIWNRMITNCLLTSYYPTIYFSNSRTRYRDSYGLFCKEECISVSVAETKSFAIKGKANGK
jgi:hypothetical protein